MGMAYQSRFAVGPARDLGRTSTHTVQTMKATLSYFSPVGLAVRALFTLILLLVSGLAHAQTNPPRRVVRTYIPPDQLVSFVPTTPFDQFIDILNPIFKRETGKMLVDPDSHKEPIGIPISVMHFMDAFELVLERKGLGFRETDGYFIVESVPQATGDATVVPVSTTSAAQSHTRQGELLATRDTREIQINAILFEINHTRARDLGLDWNVLFGEGGTSQSGSGGQGSGAGGQNQGRFYLNTNGLNENFGEVITAPASISFSQLTSFLRAYETQGAGETIANPQITVQSGEKGLIQIGSDVPVNTRDYAGNTVTQFFSTGTIIDVTPTVISEAAYEDSVEGEPLDFIHLNVKVEKSNSRPSTAGIIIDRNQATTQVLLLPGEQTIIGGLYSTEESISRRGVPILKDLPGWFFGLRYLFGHNARSVIQKELLIVLQADMLDPLVTRSQRPYDTELIRQRRREVREAIERVSDEAADKVKFRDVNGRTSQE